jgi:hypothetical protein
MRRIEGEIVIHRPVEEVFGFVADERNEPQYNPQMLRVEQISSGPIGRGTLFRCVMGRNVEMTWAITAYERPRRLCGAGRAMVRLLRALPTMDIQGTLTFDPVPGGTRMRWSWQLEPLGIFRLLTPLIGRLGQRQEATIWAGLKQLLERQETPQPSLLDGGTPMQNSCARGALVAVDAFAAVTAVGGGLALATGVEGDRFPAGLLKGTPFRSYRVPGLMLAGLVGASATGAAAATLRSPRAGGPASLLAGVVLMAWIVGENRILKQPVSRGTWMEDFYFVVGLLMAVLGLTVGRDERRRRFPRGGERPVGR